MMKWCFTVRGGHTHVRVFVAMPGRGFGKCGDLCFRNEEFELFRQNLLGSRVIFFINETPEETPA